MVYLLGHTYGAWGRINHHPLSKNIQAHTHDWAIRCYSGTCPWTGIHRGIRCYHSREEVKITTLIHQCKATNNNFVNAYVDFFT